MRVLHLHTAYRERGGEDVVVAAERALLRRAGIDVVAVDAANPDTRLGALAALVQAPHRPRAARGAAALVRELQPDVAHVHNTWFAMSPAVVPALARAGVPTVVTLHNYRVICPGATLFHHGRSCHDCVGTHPWHAVRHRCVRDSAALSAVGAATSERWRRGGALAAATTLIALTPRHRELLVRGGLPADRLVVRPHALEDRGHRHDPPSASSTVLYVGRLSPEKGVAELASWWGARPRGLTLEVVGDGPLRGALEAAAHPGVVLLGPRDSDDVARRLRRARAVWVPSRCEEAFGLVVVEALNAGLPVVTSGLGGLAELAGPDAGLVAPHDDDAGWERALAALADDAWVDRAGAAARRRYETHHSPDAGLASLLGIYADAIDHAPCGPRDTR